MIARQLRRAGHALVATALIVLSIAPAATAAEGDAKVRTEVPESLAGYIAEAQGAPASVLFFEPVFPIPVDPGDPHFSSELSYTSTELQTGPQGRAVSSSVWPGPAFGDGFNSVCGECGQDYPVRSVARYPGGPEEHSQEMPGLQGGMRTSAKGLDVVARATSSASPNEEALGLGNVASRTVSTVQKADVVSATVASAQDISIGGGVIKIESVKTTLEARSDGKKAVTEGVTKVSGLTINGNGYTFDNGGLQPVQDGERGDGQKPPEDVPGEEELRKELGIEMKLTNHQETIAGPDAQRSAGGLVISISTVKLKQALNEPLGEIVGAIPNDEIQGHLAVLIALAPRIDYVFGRGMVQAAGTPPLDLDLGGFGDLPPPLPPAPTAGGFGSPALGGGDAGFAAPTVAESGLDSTTAPNPLAVGPAPAAAAQPAAVNLDGLFGGLSPGLVALGLLMAAAGAYGLSTLSGMAMGGLLGSLCDAGAVRKVPNLRS